MIIYHQFIYIDLIMYLIPIKKKKNIIYIYIIIIIIIVLYKL